MKTLDEVIKAYEVCHASVLSCDGCPYDNGMRYRDSDCYIADALHYLKEYKKYDDTLCALPDYYEWLRSADNDPLSWDDLKEMEGKPVWVELNSEYGSYSHWGIIHSFPKAGYEFMELYGFHDIVSFSVMQKEQGKTWQAYPKERA